MLDLQNMTIAEIEELKNTINIALTKKHLNALNKLVTEHAGETLSTIEIANIMQCKWQAVSSLMWSIRGKNHREHKKITKTYVNIENPDDTITVEKERIYYTIANMV